MSAKYKWNRFWCSRDKFVNLDNGFLYDPQSEYGKYHNPNAKPLEEFLSYQCLVLLGDPGLGKSFEVEMNRPLTINEKTENEKELLVNLNTCQSDHQLEKKILHNPIFESWRNSDHQTLYLTLESFDECLIRVEILNNLLLEILKESPIDRLYLRIVCRTGYWPSALEIGLKKLWEKDAVKIIELMPLRRVDVENAARMESINISAFMAKIASQNISSFAARPITLRFLLNRFKASGDLPGNQIEMYNEGCLMLCEEVNPFRINTSTAGSLSSKARLIVASRIAAALIFTGKTTIWNAANCGDISVDAIPIQALIGFEQIDGQPILIDERVLQETLATGIFSSRGQNLLGWAHQTYGEFLAANYLKLHSAKEKIIMSLISVNYRNGKRLIPQLFPVTAWIAGMIPTMFRQVMKMEPEVLLLGDIAATTDCLKAEFVEAFLTQLDNTGVIDWAISGNLRYDRVKHSGLAEQLKCYLSDKAKNETVRIEALNIAKECGLEELGNIISDIALDVSDNQEVRSTAAFVVSRIGKDNDKAKLRTIVFTEDQDSHNKLKRYALLAVWPNSITAEELFSILTPTQRNNYLDSSFISDHILNGLKPLDLPIAVKWVLSQYNDEEMTILDIFPEKILQLGWKNLNVPGVIESIIPVILRRIRNYKSIFGEKYCFSDDDMTRRRMFFEFLISNYELNQELAQDIVSSNPSLIYTEDINWLLEKLTSNILPSRDEQRFWAYLLDHIWYRGGNLPDVSAQIFAIYQKNPDIADIFASSFSAIELSSKYAEKQKEYYLKRKEWEVREERKAKTKNRDGFNMKERVNTFVERVESGILNDWWNLCHLLTFDESGDQLKSDHLSNIADLPGWKIIEGNLQSRIIAIAELYLINRNPEPDKWISSDKFYAPDFAGFKAIRLLYSHSPERLEIIPIEVWKKWIPVIMCYPEWVDNQDGEFHQRVIKLAHTKDPTQVISSALKAIDKVIKNSGYLYRLNKFDYIWNDDLAASVFAKLKRRGIKSEVMSFLLQKLSLIKYEPAIKHAKINLKTRRNREKAIIYTQFLLDSEGLCVWNLIMETMKIDVEFGKELMLSMTSPWDNMALKLMPKLNEEQLGILYLWIVKHFPYEEDPHHEGVYSPTPRDDLTKVRSKVLELLVEKGSDEAVIALSKIVKELPKHDWLVVILNRAQKARHQRIWMPPTSEEVLSLIKSNRSRLVKNGDHLLEVVIDGLRQIQYKMQGETPLAFALWDKVRDHQYRPKSENDFSDLIKVLLEYELVNRGVVLNREVEIRRNRGGTSGQRTDIHVEAVSNTNTNDVVKVIIEAKGCWHDKLESAMETQLANGYLKENECNHGVYLVGWFNCKQWDPDDKSSRRQAFKNDYVGLVRKLDRQAEQLSIGDVLIKAFVIDVSLR
ncbi:NACHT domain-containing protein [Propionispora vibrioides]|uniref:Uncharacterized protein n=1 Tax=Propionispora vibrioides TaxID=112903 RepID=A0A1H8Y5S7_9FIRM|nr:hypothetical protein [Propionispora vibrioides]SEP46878.1 hypothetical protein SAMN04490178_14126 [Propionispora vibrioides]